MIKPYIKALIFFLFAPFSVFAASYFELQAPPSFADHIKLIHAKDHVDKGWLPELTGLPDQDQIAMLTQALIDLLEKYQDPDPRCKSINLHLKMLMFQHFLIYQHLVNAQGIYLDDKIANQWAHIMAMILKESSGDSTSITDMSGKTITTNRARTNIYQWRKMFTLMQTKGVQMNYQTNFGLTQLSADRLSDAFNIAKALLHNRAFLEGKEGADTPGKIELNTAIAIRRLIWFYQDFAQGRTSESEDRIPEQDINKPAYQARYFKGLELALVYCGTRFMFRKDCLKDCEERNARLKQAMASIAYCKLGNSQQGYGVSEMDETCFARWVTLCPALNIDIAILTPLAYFATRNVLPVCEKTFKRLLIKKQE
jgi:hypothetical protein